MKRKIKSGQLWKANDPNRECYGMRYIISKVTNNKVHIIVDNDCVICCPIPDFYLDITQMKLIKTFPTWKEAVNSKEFNGG